ncbi:MAG TPA: hypothetical protein VFJ82_00705 [Longimicrobium sp.]|nr:hypothetical protein [Longimicrobium sp.]
MCILLAACGKGAEGHPSRDGRRALVMEEVVQLDDAGQPILARPERLSVAPDGRFFVADFSDKNVKVYAPIGRRALTIGRPGRGPGEFQALMTAQAYGDSLVAFDFLDRRLSVFAPDGRFVRRVPLTRLAFPPFSVRVVDDSLFLAVAAMPGGERQHALALLRPDGSLVSTFFDVSRYLGGSPMVLQNVGLIADGMAGVVFAGIAGGDSVWAFDYAGKRLGAAAVDPVDPLPTTRALLEGNGGRLARPGGGYVVDGVRNLVGLVALDSGSVAMQVARYDAETGTDPLEGGTFIVAALAKGRLATIARADLAAGLAGRDRRGAPLVLRYADAEQEHYAIARLRLADAESARTQGP